MNRLLFMFFILLIIFLSFDTITMAYEKEIKDLSISMAEDIAKSGKKRIAVVDFTDLQGNVTELGRFLAEEFSVALAGAGKGFEVVDRTHLKSIIAEHKLSATGIIDPQTARKLGQIAGVEALITGTITPFGDSVRLSAKILDTATAKVIGASTANIAKTKAIEELLARGIESVADTATSTGTTTLLPPRPKTLSRVEVADFTFEARECRIRGQKVLCTIAVVNNDPKVRRLQVYLRNPGQSILVDDLGNQYNSAAGWFGGKGGEWYGVEQEVPTGLPMNLVIEYRDVVTTAKYVNVVIDFWSNTNLKAVLRNIPLSK